GDGGQVAVERDDVQLLPIDPPPGLLQGAAQSGGAGHDLGVVHGREQRTGAVGTNEIRAGLTEEQGQHGGGVEDGTGHGTGRAAGRPPASASSRAASARRSAINSSTTLAPGGTNWRKNSWVSWRTWS